MKKIYTFLIMVCAVFSMSAQGFNTSYVVISVNNGGNTYYRMNGANNWGDTNPDLNGANLGTFMMGDITKLNLKGLQGNVYKNAGAGEDVTNVNLNYIVYPAGESAPEFKQLSVLPGGTVGDTGGSNGFVDQRWENITQNILLLSDGANPLNAGDYVLEIFLSANTNNGTEYLSNDGSNYKANFKIVDETLWNGSAWNNGSPNVNINAIIDGNYSNIGNLETKGLTINSDKNLTIPTGSSIKVFGNVINNGSIVVKSDANFVQQNGSLYSGTGTGKVERVANLKKLDFNFWGSPVTGQNLYTFSDGYDQSTSPSNPQGTPWNQFLVYDEATDYFVTTGLDVSTTFQPGIGYAIRGKEKYGTSLTQETFVFNGSLNNGPLNVNLKKTTSDGGFNLVANPYPSNIDAIALMNSNSGSIISTLWFWTNQNEVTAQQGSGYDGNNYATTNLSGSNSATYVGPSNGSENTNLRPKRYIKVSQGFIVQAKINGGTLNFTNALRSNSSLSNFYNKQIEEDDENNKDRYWLKLISPQNIVNTILVAYVDGATNNYEDGYDADLMVVGSDSFYSVLGAHKLQIQGRKPGLDLDDVVALGNKHYVAGKNTIALDDKNGIFANGQAIYLKDKITGKVTNLQDESYSFDSAAGEFADRFEIVYKTTLAVGDTPSKKINIFKDQSDFVIRTPNQVQSVDLYDMSGRMIQSINAKNTSGADIRINHTQLNKGVYIIRVNQNGEIFTQKVIK